MDLGPHARFHLDFLCCRRSNDCSSDRLAPHRGYEGRRQLSRSSSDGGIKRHSSSGGLECGCAKAGPNFYDCCLYWSSRPSRDFSRCSNPSGDPSLVPSTLILNPVPETKMPAVDGDSRRTANRSRVSQSADLANGKISMVNILGVVVPTLCPQRTSSANSTEARRGHQYLRREL